MYLVTYGEMINGIFRVIKGIIFTDLKSAGKWVVKKSKNYRVSPAYEDDFYSDDDYKDENYIFTCGDCDMETDLYMKMIVVKKVSFRKEFVITFYEGKGVSFQGRIERGCASLRLPDIK